VCPEADVQRELIARATCRDGTRNLMIAVQIDVITHANGEQRAP